MIDAVDADVNVLSDASGGHGNDDSGGDMAILSLMLMLIEMVKVMVNEECMYVCMCVYVCMRVCVCMYVCMYV